MEGTSRGIVHEVLTKDNYERWKILMKNYLVGKNLWAAVESGAVNESEWDVEYGADSTEEDDQRRKNAEALHLIQLSCGLKVFDEISHCKTAQEAWKHLKSRYSSDLKAQPDIDQGHEVDNTLSEYRRLYEFVEKGYSDGTKAFIKGNKSALDKKSASGRTILHVATMAGHVNVVEVLVIEGGDSLVTQKDKWDYTALALAAHYTGNKAVAECMVEKVGGGVREDLLCIENEDGEIPLLLAADKGHKQMTRYLYDKTPKDVLYGPDSGNRVVFLFERCIKAEIFDVALNILDYEQKELPDQQQLQLATKSVPYGFPALHHLAQTPSAFFSSRIQGKIIYYRWFCRSVSNFLHLPVKLLGIRETYEQKRTHYQVQQILTHLQRSIKKFNRSQLDEASVYDAMLLAAKHGNVEFIESMTKANPSLLWAIDRRKRGVFAHAILCRKEKVFQLVHTQARGNDKLKYATDVFGNNLLHLAAHLGPSSDLNYMPGAALQMQRELQWFKAVEEIVDPMCKEAKNDEDKKPHELFTETHVELVKAGEKWAKDAANSFTLVGALIITIMFTAAFTVPGGNNQDTGVPIFLNNDIFTALVVADAISLFTSATSVLIFIWILTSRYAEKDFLRSLPMKLLFGLLFLFLSVVFMLVAFSAALVIILNKYQTHNRLFIGGAIFVSIPVIILVPSQLRLIFEIFQSTISNPISVR